MRTIEHWIGGAATPAGATTTAPVCNPATGQVQAQVVLATESDVDSAVSSAAKAFESWGNSSLTQRTRVTWEERAVESSKFMLERVTKELATHL